MFSHPEKFADRYGKKVSEEDPEYENTLDGWRVSTLRKAAAALVQEWRSPNSRYARRLGSYCKSRQA